MRKIFKNIKGRFVLPLVALAAVTTLGFGLTSASALVYTGSGACAAAGSNPAPVSQWDHIIVVPMENQKSTKMLGTGAADAVGGTTANSLNALADSCGSNSGHNIANGTWDASNSSPLYKYRNTTHKSLPNYISLTSGSDYNETLGPDANGNPGPGEDCAATVQSCKQGKGQFSDNIFSALDRAGVSWKNYAEAIGTPCNTSDNKQLTGYNPVVNPNGYTQAAYVARHAPAVYYGVNDYGNASTDSGTLPGCNTKVVDSSDPNVGFFHDLTSNTLPRFSIVSPALCNDMHQSTSGVTVPNQCSATGAVGTSANAQSAGQRYLMGTATSQGLLDYIVNSPTYQNSNTLVFVWWDESGATGTSGDPGYRCYDDTNTADGCYIPLIVMSKNTPAGSQLNTPTNHYGMLKMLQDLLNAGPAQSIPYIGHAADASTSSFAADFNLVPGGAPLTPPTVSTTAASGLTATAATLNGTVNPNSKATTYYFEYGTTTAYGTTTSVTSAGSGSSAQAVNAAISGLTQSTSYHYRVVATNSDGTSYGNDQSFQTQSASSCGTYTAPDIADTYVNQGAPNGNNGTQTIIKASFGGAQAKIGFIRFDTSAVPANCVVDSVSLSVTNGSTTTNSSENLTVSSLSFPDSWQESTLTWNTGFPATSGTLFTGSGIAFNAGATLNFNLTPGTWLGVGSGSTSSVRLDSTTAGAKSIATKEQTTYNKPTLTIVTHATVNNSPLEWDMDESPIAANSPVSELFGRLNGTTPANWNGSAVAPLAPTGTGAFNFPGWKNRDANNLVDATASSYTIANDSRLNPDTSNFTVSLYVKASDPTALVNSGVILSTDTLNIAQKGKAGTTNNQWKVSVNAIGKFICTFRGPNASGVVTDFFAKSAVAYTWEVSRQITCNLNPTTHQITGTITNNAGGTDTFTAAGPQSVTTTEPVTVGKKPGTTYAGDTFAGVIDNLVITKN